MFKKIKFINNNSIFINNNNNKNSRLLQISVNFLCKNKFFQENKLKFK